MKDKFLCGIASCSGLEVVYLKALMNWSVEVVCGRLGQSLKEENFR